MMMQRNSEADQGPPQMDKDCIIVEGLIREGQRVNIHESAEVAGIKKGSFHEIISYPFCSNLVLYL